MRITFLGAAREVTGSACRVETARARVLVDCGMFQGDAAARRRNERALDWDVAALDCVLITHAHIDHSGLVPLLVKRGYRGPIYATSASVDLMSIMLMDSAQIQAKDAGWRAPPSADARDHRSSGEGDVRPLYTVADTERALGRLHGLPYDESFQPHTDVTFAFRDAGHILGAAIVELWLRDGERTRKLVFSGDLGQPARPVVRDPTPIAEADVLVVESTYGNRRHRGMQETRDELVAVVNETFRRGGNVIVPAFAVGRTQELITILAEEARAGRIGGFDVYVDSPLASRATAVTLRHRRLLDAQSRRALLDAMRGRVPLRVHFTEDVAESQRLNGIRSGALIIAGSGMCDGGRIRYHLARNIVRSECALLFTGFQAEGTLGRRIVDGAERVRVLGEDLPVLASVHTLGGLSAHADRDALLGWLCGFDRAPKQTFVVHGEAATAVGFAQTIGATPGWRAHAPAQGEQVEIV